MKYLAVFIFSFCLVFPVFSQNTQNRRDTSNQRFKALSDAIGKTASDSTSNLEYYDDLVLDNGNTRNYLEYQRRHKALTKSLKEREARLDFEIRTNGTDRTIKDERDKYEGLVHQAEDLKSEYDEWLRNVK